MKLFAAIIFVILVGLQARLWFGEGAFMEVQSLKKEVAIMQERNNVQKNRNITLEAEVQDLKSRLAALEERARIDLGMIKKGETFYQNVQ
jgi:cell division protein FtsB